MAPIEDVAFPRLTASEVELIRHWATPCVYADGEAVFQAGQADVNFYVVESGQVEIRNPADHGQVIVTHGPGQFSGDIDLLTGRPVMVTAVARGPTRVWCVPNTELRQLLNRVPSLGEKLIAAFTRRRELLSRMDDVGMRVIGPGRCRATNRVREFLYKNFVPCRWVDPETPAGQQLLSEAGPPRRMPLIQFGNGSFLRDPSLPELAREAGLWKHCPTQEVDFAIVGAGPAGMAAAVYASSEGLSTLMLDAVGPGGQAGGSSRIENFIGFPAGLTGADLAMRGVVQMLKFGARLVAPVVVEKVTPAPSLHDLHGLHLDCGAEIRCRVLLLAVGVRWRQLEAAGADRFAGAGIYYACTRVEADLYDRADVAVVGAGNSAGQAATFLAECCPSRTVHLLVRHALGPHMSDYLVERLRKTPNVKIREETEIEALDGKARLEAITTRNNRTQEQDRLPCAAVFVFIGADPSTEWLPAGIARDGKGYVLTGAEVFQRGLWPCQDRDPCPLETSVPGILAAGDMRSESPKRVGFAVGDGSLAVACAHRLISIRR